MKKLIFSLFAITVLLSCTNKKTESDIELIKIIDSEREFYFDEIIGRKVNANNEIQCSNYAYIRVGSDTIISYGNNLKKTISSINNLNERYVKISDQLDSLKYYSLKYISNGIDSNDISLIHEKIEEKLNISINKKNLEVTAYELLISDKSLLPISIDNLDKSYSKVQSNQIIFTNANLRIIVNQLNMFSDFNFKSNKNDSLNFDMEIILNNDINILEQQFAKYGISLKRVKINKEFIFIE